MRIGVNIVQAHPDTEFAEFFAQIVKFRGDLVSLPRAFGVFEIDAICGCILRDDEEFFRARFHERFGFVQDAVERATYEIAA